jgi:hypothetical protein
VSDDALELVPTGPGRWWRRKIRLNDVGVAIGSDRLAWAGVAYYLYNDGLLLYAKGGRHYFLISTNYDRWEDACERVISELHRRFAERADFWPFTLTAEGLVYEPDDVALPFTQLDRVVIEHGPTLEVWLKGMPFAPVTHELATVRNSLLLLDRLIERGVRVESNTPLWVPRATPHLATVASAAVGLPQAKLRR